MDLEKELTEAYSRFQKAHDAGDFEAAKQLRDYATALEGQLAADRSAPPQEDKGGISRAFQSGDATTAANTRDFMADAEEGLGNTAIGRGYDYLIDLVHGKGTAAKNRAKFLKENRDAAAAERKAADSIGFEPTVKSWRDIRGVGDAASYLGEGLAGSAPKVVAGAAGGLGLVPGALMFSGDANKEIAARAPETSPGERAAIAAGVGVPSAVLNALGINPVVKGAVPGAAAANIGIAGLASGATNAAQEGLQIGGEKIAGVKHKDGESFDRIIEASGGGTIGGVAGRTGIEVAGGLGRGFKDIAENGNPFAARPSTNPDADIQFNEKLRRNAHQMSGEGLPEDGGVAPGAKKLLKDIAGQEHGEASTLFNTTADQINTQISILRQDKSIRKYFKPDEAVDAADRQRRLEAAQVTRSDKNFRGFTPEEAIDSIDGLIGHTQAGQQMVSLLRQRNSAASLWRKGLQGGLSRYTDQIAPFSKSRGGNAVRAAASAVPAMASGGGTLAAQLGLYGAGRVADAATGRRSNVWRAVKRNRGKTVAPEFDDTLPLDAAVRKAAKSGDVETVAQALAKYQAAVDTAEKAKTVAEAYRQSGIMPTDADVDPKALTQALRAYDAAAKKTPKAAKISRPAVSDTTKDGIAAAKAQAILEREGLREADRVDAAAAKVGDQLRNKLLAFDDEKRAFVEREVAKLRKNTQHSTAEEIADLAAELYDRRRETAEAADAERTAAREAREAERVAAKAKREDERSAAKAKREAEATAKKQAREAEKAEKAAERKIQAAQAAEKAKQSDGETPQTLKAKRALARMAKLQEEAENALAYKEGRQLRMEDPDDYTIGGGIDAMTLDKAGLNPHNALKALQILEERGAVKKGTAAKYRGDHDFGARRLGLIHDAMRKLAEGEGAVPQAPGWQPPEVRQGLVSQSARDAMIGTQVGASASIADAVARKYASHTDIVTAAHVIKSQKTRSGKRETAERIIAKHPELPDLREDIMPLTEFGPKNS